MVAPATKMLVGWRLKLVDADAIQSWAAARLAERKDPTGEIVELVRGDKPQTEQILVRIVAVEASEFSDWGATSQAYAKDLWLERLRNYVSGNGDPWSVCRSVDLIENAYDFPEWLGDMYNACDWVETDWKRSNAPGVELVATEIINEFG